MKERDEGPAVNGSSKRMYVARYISLSLSPSLSHTHTNSLSLSLTHTHTNSQSLSLSITLFFSQTHIHFPRQTEGATHSHSFFSVSHSSFLFSHHHHHHTPLSLQFLIGVGVSGGVQRNISPNFLSIAISCTQRLTCNSDCLSIRRSILYYDFLLERRNCGAQTIFTRPPPFPIASLSSTETHRKQKVKI